MIEHKQFAAHPVRQMLRRAAKTGAVPDATELAEVDAPPEVVQAVRMSARALADHRETAGCAPRTRRPPRPTTRHGPSWVPSPGSYSASVMRQAEGTLQ